MPTFSPVGKAPLLFRDRHLEPQGRIILDRLLNVFQVGVEMPMSLDAHAVNRRAFRDEAFEEQH